MAKRHTRPTGRRINGTHYLAERADCVRGHKLEGDNLIVRLDASHPNGGRMCRTCSRTRARLYSCVRYWRSKLEAHQSLGSHPIGVHCEDCALPLGKFTTYLKMLDKWREDGRRR